MASDAGSEQPSARRRPPRWLAPAIVMGIVAADQLSKVWVVAALSDGPQSIIGDDVQLSLTRNSGASFSLFAGATPVLAVLAVVLSIFLVRAVRRERDPLMVVALSLVLGGALGNLCDRVFRAPGFMEGHVVDFVQVGSFPTFNVADSAITIGAILLIVLSLRRAPADPAPS